MQHCWTKEPISVPRVALLRKPYSANTLPCASGPASAGPFLVHTLETIPRVSGLLWCGRTQESFRASRHWTSESPVCSEAGLSRLVVLARCLSPTTGPTAANDFAPPLGGSFPSGPALFGQALA